MINRINLLIFNKIVFINVARVCVQLKDHFVFIDCGLIDFFVLLLNISNV